MTASGGSLIPIAVRGEAVPALRPAGILPAEKKGQSAFGGLATWGWLLLFFIYKDDMHPFLLWMYP
jgi:hypothetical protein